MVELTFEKPSLVEREGRTSLAINFGEFGRAARTVCACYLGSGHLRVRQGWVEAQVS